MATEISKSLEDDGVEHQGVRNIAHLAKSGRNAARDFVRLCKRRGFLGRLTPVLAEVSVLEKRTGLPQLENISVITADGGTRKPAQIQIDLKSRRTSTSPHGPQIQMDLNKSKWNSTNRDGPQQNQMDIKSRWTSTSRSAIVLI
jgi:hypothetical protein